MLQTSESEKKTEKVEPKDGEATKVQMEEAQSEIDSKKPICSEKLQQNEPDKSEQQKEEKKCEQIDEAQKGNEGELAKPKEEEKPKEPNPSEKEPNVVEKEPNVTEEKPKMEDKPAEIPEAKREDEITLQEKVSEEKKLQIGTKGCQEVELKASL